MLRVTYRALLFVLVAVGGVMGLADDSADDSGPSPAGVPTLALPEDAHHAPASDDVADGDAPTPEHAPEAVGDDDHSDSGHAKHDPTDLAHANAGPSLHDPSELRFDLAICTFLVFLVLLILLRVVAWKPILRGLDQREQTIVSRIEHAQHTAEEADKKLREYQARLDGASEEAQTIIAQARKDAELLAERIRADAKAEADRQRDRAIADIQAAKNNAVRDVAAQSADMAVLLAGRIVHRELKPEDHASLITEALERFPSNN